MNIDFLKDTKSLANGKTLFVCKKVNQLHEECILQEAIPTFLYEGS